MTKTRMGRPREFDEETVLDAAMRVFWDKGYEGTSMADLANVMKLSPSSIYAAFGDKKALFQRAADKYAKDATDFYQGSLAQPTFRAVIQDLLAKTVDYLTTPGHPRTCFTLGAMPFSSDTEPIRLMLLKVRKRGQAALKARLEIARKSGDLSSDTDAADLARFISVVIGGLVIQAEGGASKAEMRRTASLTLRYLGF
ncbi:TetR/AcrR family transcriptional regulator [Granulicella sp. L60]|uniref:TetR/AcrR family transcriptional regulator n=1 Tax=Granulicella sp. L60 TaxID=1641866 RepID=UPI00131C2BEC|nr:TetR/AcrR family transcriptional regulator [Granulicella sp. L60]